MGARRFIDGDANSQLNAANLNTLDRGGNVYQNAGGGLSVDISGFNYIKSTTGTLIAFAALTAQAVTDNATNYVYISNAGALVINTSGFPASYAVAPYIPLATVTTSAGAITGIVDKRALATIPI